MRREVRTLVITCPLFDVRYCDGDSEGYIDLEPGFPIRFYEFLSLGENGVDAIRLIDNQVIFLPRGSYRVLDSQGVDSRGVVLDSQEV